MDVWKAAADRQRIHGDVLALAAGQPSTPAPQPVVAAAQKAIVEQVLGYTESTGILPLKETIADYYGRREGVEVDPSEVVITTGSSGAFTILFLAAFDVGDTVVMARPGYPAYRNVLQALGCRVHELDCGPDERFQPTLAMLEALSEPPAGLIIASPANPTGTIIDPAEFTAIAQWCAEHGVLLISDEIYHGISFGDLPQLCAWKASREAAVVGSVSKYFSMTGWRLGWMLVPSRYRDAVNRLASNLTVCPPAVSQYAAMAAFCDESLAELDGHVQRYRRNRDILLEGLEERAISKFAPADGAFYLYADVSHLTSDSTAWCARVLAETGVAMAPGIDFDTLHGSRTIRLCFAGATATMHEALERLAPMLRDF
ncbi:pyridoxal phosphate-dependent aminotransferase [Hoyosella altamirensis]|nr:pyridoxal phosphate-dependent aminotransferase [Hoyosella altamirensis]